MNGRECVCRGRIYRYCLSSSLFQGWPFAFWDYGLPIRLQLIPSWNSGLLSVETEPASHWEGCGDRNSFTPCLWVTISVSRWWWRHECGCLKCCNTRWWLRFFYFLPDTEEQFKNPPPPPAPLPCPHPPCKNLSKCSFPDIQRSTPARLSSGSYCTRRGSARTIGLLEDEGQRGTLTSWPSGTRGRAHTKSPLSFPGEPSRSLSPSRGADTIQTDPQLCGAKPAMPTHPTWHTPLQPLLPTGWAVTVSELPGRGQDNVSFLPAAGESDTAGRTQKAPCPPATVYLLN